ncbi:MAG TPA: T9SS type A sorting domain-containing protein [Bacteroidota bacterium]|nr:T9SS type A sorting domain-containing protein [Bacteroidota bacterium]
MTLMLYALPAFAQTNFAVTILAEDGSGWVDSVKIGKYTTATNGITDSISPLLVEAELPPVPPAGSEQAADLRLDDPAGGGAYGQGVGVDVRHLVSDGQKDIYRLKFRRSGEGTGVTLSWPAGLDAVGGGGFYLSDGLGGFVFPTVAMHEVTSFDVPAPYDGLSGGFVDIVVGDGSMMRTFHPDSISLAVDSKGKYGKYQKRKPIANEFQITLNAPARAEGAEFLYIDFSMKILDGLISFPGNGHVPINFGSSQKKFTFSFVPPLDSAQTVVINATGDKGKAVKGKYYFYNTASLKLDKKTKTVWATDYQILRMPFPNVNNIGEELYEQGVTLGIGLTTQVGTTLKKGLPYKPIFRSISVPKKWKDVTKTLWKYKKPVVHLQTHGTAQCLDTIKGKINYKKPIKSIDPLKYIRYKGDPNYGNPLVAHMLALKFNIAISAKDKTPAQGFGELIYTNAGHPLDGKTVNDIALHGDSALSCWGGLPSGWSYQDLADFLETLNNEFSGPFDTVSFGSPADGKPVGGTVATGVKAVALSDIFTGSGASFAPAAPADYSSLYDVPEVFSLSQNYPNPFNPTTTIEFTIPEDAIVSLKVYNMLGQEVATLADLEEFTAGENWVELDGATLATGIYYYRISVNDGQFQEVRKMVLMK